MRLLVTRPEPDATRTAQALRARGHEVMAVPVLTTQPVAADFAGSYDAVLLTSANAARALTDHPRAGELTQLPCLTVGERSADAAHAAGFAEVASADGAFDDLVRMVAARFAKRSGKFLYLAGEDRVGDLAGALEQHGLAVETVVIYRTVAVERLPAELTLALAASRLDGVLHYSPRSAATLIRLGEEAGMLHELLRLAHYCMSEAVARTVRDAGATRIDIAAHPDESALIALL